MRTRADETASDAPNGMFVAWRRGRLLHAGFSPTLAAKLAESQATDLHAILELVDRGCPPRLAARILAPLGRPTLECPGAVKPAQGGSCA